MIETPHSFGLAVSRSKAMSEVVRADSSSNSNRTFINYKGPLSLFANFRHARTPIEKTEKNVRTTTKVLSSRSRN